MDEHYGLKRLIAYHEGTLPAAEREAVQEHLSLCPRCTGRLRELREFEAAVARGDAGPEPLRQAAWDSLVQRLPEKTPVVRPIAGAARREAPRRRVLLPWATAAAAALLLLLAGAWAVITVRQERREVARLEQRLQEQDASLAALRRSLAEAERRLAGLKATPPVPEPRDQIASASPPVELSISPRFVLRGQEPPASDFLRAGGVVNAVPRKDRLVVTLSLAAHPAYDEYRFQLQDRQGKALWTGRRPGGSVLGDAGTSLAVSGLGPGRYRLRVEGLGQGRGELLDEYVLDVQR